MNKEWKTNMMDRRLRVWRKGKLEGWGKLDRKMQPSSTIEKFAGGTKMVSSWYPLSTSAIIPIEFFISLSQMTMYIIIIILYVMEKEREDLDSEFLVWFFFSASASSLIRKRSRTERDEVWIWMIRRRWNGCFLRNGPKLRTTILLLAHCGKGERMSLLSIYYRLLVLELLLFWVLF